MKFLVPLAAVFALGSAAAAATLEGRITPAETPWGTRAVHIELDAHRGTRFASVQLWAEGLQRARSGETIALASQSTGGPGQGWLIVCNRIASGVRGCVAPSGMVRFESVAGDRVGDSWRGTLTFVDEATTVTLTFKGRVTQALDPQPARAPGASRAAVSAGTGTALVSL